MKGKFWKKAGSLLLSAAMLFGGAAVVIPQVADSGIEVQAAGSNFNNAMKISVNKDYTDSISDSNDCDYYYFTLNSDSKVNIKFSHNYIDSSNTYWRMYIYKNDNENTQIFNYDFQGNKKTQISTSIGLPKGSYYLKIECDRYSGDRYTFAVNALSTSNWEKETNDTFETATKVNVNKEFYGTIGYHNSWYDFDSDYYKFTINNDSKVNIRFKHNFIDSESTYWKTTLYRDDNEYTEIVTCQWNGKLKDGTSCNIGLPKGTYYIKVYDDKFSDLDYCITINAVSVSNWEKETNDTFETATKVDLNKEFYGSIMYYDQWDDNDSDFYKFSISGKRNIKIKFKHNYIDSGSVYWELRLFKDDNTNSELNSWDFVGNKTSETTDSIALTSGTYFIRVNGAYRYHTDIDYGITVIDPQSADISANSVSLSNSNISLGKGETFNLTATVSPSNATNKTVTWTTSNSSVATVSNGRVTAKSAGTATITAKTSNGKTATCKVTVKASTTGDVVLNKSSMAIGKGETYKLTANKSVTWSTSNSRVATVSNGKVTAKNNGTATITAKTSNGKTAKCTVTVKNAPSKITLTKGILTLGVGESFTVGSGVNDGAACATRTYRTSNSSIVRMTRTDWNGVFVGVKPGVAYVTVRTYNGKESTCKVTVKAAPTTVTLNKTNITLRVGQSASLSASIPSNAGCATRTFSSSNNSIVKMTKTNWTGEFKAMKPGVAYVTVRTYNGKQAKCKVTVIK